MKSNLFFMLFVALVPLSQSAQEVGKVQFFPYGYCVDNDHYGEDPSIWKYSDTLNQKRVFLDEMILKIEKHFNFVHNNKVHGIEGLNDYLMGLVFKAIEDSIILSGIQWEDEQYWPKAKNLFENFIQNLISGYETELFRDDYWTSKLPFSFRLNNEEKNHLFNLMDVEDFYWLSTDMTLKKNNEKTISYGSMAMIGKNYYRFQNWPDSTYFMGVSVPAGVLVQAFLPDSTPVDIESEIYHSMLDTFKVVYSYFSQTDSAARMVFTTPKSKTQICSSYYSGLYGDGYWFSIGYFNNEPLWFIPGRPRAILRINGKIYWILEFDYPDIGLVGFNFYLEEESELKLIFESSLFSI
ncbi:MAG: hypothetical protein CVU11_01905 [Bacteroidetes bacterium HGW-Bacteroidetes-6]|jgi:hypothetical protein|nr:MAG: hypothetical protein CVU11_01905 [Bacteroidetes bacterium HGW-Bacteroidetes-6]